MTEVHCRGAASARILLDLPSRAQGMPDAWRTRSRMCCFAATPALAVMSLGSILGTFPFGFRHESEKAAVKGDLFGAGDVIGRGSQCE